MPARVPEAKLNFLICGINIVYAPFAAAMPAAGPSVENRTHRVHYEEDGRSSCCEPEPGASRGDERTVAHPRRGRREKSGTGPARRPRIRILFRGSREH